MIALLFAVALAQEPPPGDLPPLTIDPPPQVGVESIVTLVDDLDRGEPGATVQVVHRSGLSGERQKAIGITDSRGRVRWTPEMGGRAVVHAGDQELPVAIAWDGPPAATVSVIGLLSAVAAGLLGFGVLPRRAPKPSVTP